ncbi:MAG: YHS domain-containing (seleno)protein [Pseudomonadota bacterium]
MTLTRRALLATAAAFTALPAFAEQPRWFSETGPAIGGYDPVAYFDENGPVKGSEEFTSEYDGGVFHFANALNKAAFDEDPATYAPQYGGYCAYAVSRGYTASTDPEAWSIHEGKLYLNFSKSVRALWATNKRGNIEAADKNWPSVLTAS